MNYNWKEVFKQAERFNKASELLNQLDEDLKIVSFTNAAFAIELYYKALFCKITGKDPRQANHDIEGIFNNLSAEVKSEIINDYNSELEKRGDNLLEQIKSIQKHLPDFTTDFKWNLGQVKSAFLNFRYVYEKGKTAVIVFYPELRMSIIKQLQK